MTRRTGALTDGPPLYGATEYSALAMSPHEKAIVAARRHLHDEHGFHVEQLAEGRSASTILKWHMQAHDVSAMTDDLSESPWTLVSLPHVLSRANRTPAVLHDKQPTVTSVRGRPWPHMLK